jgi:uncharacterized protein (TIGR03435 family)
MLRPCFLLAVATLAAAQTPPAFEVASIRIGQPFSMELLRAGGIGMKIDASRVVIHSWTLADMIGAAYKVRIDQISGPDWMGGQRFDVQATLPEGAKSDQVPDMLQSLLTERFGMAAHRGQKVMPVYALSVGKTGAKLQDSAADDTTTPGCILAGSGHRVCHRMTMQALADMLTSLSRMNANVPAGTMTWGIDAPAIDVTGLTGTYDFSMEFGPGAPENGGGSVIDATERLGLRLEAQKRPYDVIFIDRLEKNPTGN